MKKLVNALVTSVTDFFNVGIFLIFIFCLFAILGLHLYCGVFYNSCRYSPTPESPDFWLIDDSHERMCSKSGYGEFQCPADQYCGNPAEFGIPLDSENADVKPYMYYGIHSFDNLGKALQIVFQIVTTEAWSTYLYNLRDLDSGLFASLYTISIIVVGSFFLMNLVLAVIINAFITITKKELDEESRLVDEESTANGVIQASAIIDHLHQNADFTNYLWK
jgi:uncharacterized protein YxeA